MACNYLRPEFSNPENVKIDQDCREISGTHENRLFFNCQFEKLNDLTLKNCVLNRSKFSTQKLEDALGFTITLNCHSFSDVELSPLIFDLILCLLLKSAGNAAKRRAIVQHVLGVERTRELLTAMKDIE